MYYSNKMDLGYYKMGLALSTIEDEYMAISKANKDMIWLKNFFKELSEKKAVTAIVQGQSAIHLSKNPKFHAWKKHIKLRYHFTRELISNGTLSLKYILDSKNLLDMLTNVVINDKLKFTQFQLAFSIDENALHWLELLIEVLGQTRFTRVK